MEMLGTTDPLNQLTMEDLIKFPSTCLEYAQRHPASSVVSGRVKAAQHGALASLLVISHELDSEESLNSVRYYHSRVKLCAFRLVEMRPEAS